MKHLGGGESVAAHGDGPSVAMTLVAGRVTVVTGRDLQVDTGSGARSAVRSISCLVAPEPGDSVLLAVTDIGAFVVAVLDRPGAGACTLSPVEGRPLAIAAPQVDIAGAETVSLRSPKVRMEAETATLRFSAARYVGRVVNCFARALEVTADRLQSVSRASVHQAQTYARSVDGVDTLRAGDVLRQCDRSATWQSAQTIIVATGDVRIDGERIGLG